jgi:hypothetical protein
MQPKTHEDEPTSLIEDARQQRSKVEARSGHDFMLRRWLVSFSSGRQWYPVGEFVAQDAQTAIDRAIEVFGSASDYRAEAIPWDAAPLPKPRPCEKKI